MLFAKTAAAVTVLVSLIISQQLFTSYRTKPRASHAMWIVAFLLAALAALMQFVAYLVGHFTPATYRVYLLAAAAVPGFMGAGTVYLLWRRVADAFAVFTVLLGVAGVLTAFTTPLHAGVLSQVTLASASVGKVATSAWLAVVFAVQGGVGGFLALVLGAIYSYVRTRHPQNLAIALGGIVFSLADTAAAYGGVATFFPAQIVGMLLLFYGAVQGRPVARERATQSA
jgi:hypothetical protein